MFRGLTKVLFLGLWTKELCLAYYQTLVAIKDTS